MATSGNYNTSNQYIVYWIEYWLNWQDINNNSSNVTVKVWVKRTNVGYTTYGTGNVSLKINGETYNQNITSDETITNTPRCLIERTVDIKHDQDGSKSVLLEASISHQRFSSDTNGLWWTLSTIPRASSVYCADGNIGSSTTININRASSSFTHTLRYSFCNLNDTIVTKTSQTSIGWKIPTEFFEQIPDLNSSWGTIFCDTYQEDTLIGTTSCTFNVFVINSNPTISGTVTDVNSKTVDLTGDANKLIKYYSNAKVVMTATAKNSATIKSQKVVCGNKSGTNATSTLNGIESGIFNLSCTDSRGNVGTATINKEIVDYIRLAFTQLELKRPTTTSNIINASIKGNYFNASFGNVSNTLTLKFRYRIKNSDWNTYTTLIATKNENNFAFNGDLGVDFDFNNEYEFEFQAIDELATVTSSKIVTKGEPIIDIGKNDVKINGDVETKKSISNSFIKKEKDYTGEILGQKILYENEAGTNENITLIESVANFKYIEIYFKDDYWTYSSVKIPSPNNKRTKLSTVGVYQNDNVMMILTREVLIKDNSITTVDFGHYNSWNNNITKDNYIYITKVIGYK